MVQLPKFVVIHVFTIGKSTVRLMISPLHGTACGQAAKAATPSEAEDLPRQSKTSSPPNTRTNSCPRKQRKEPHQWATSPRSKQRWKRRAWGLPRSPPSMRCTLRWSAAAGPTEQPTKRFPGGVETALYSSARTHQCPCACVVAASPRTPSHPSKAYLTSTLRCACRATVQIA